MHDYSKSYAFSIRSHRGHGYTPPDWPRPSLCYKCGTDLPKPPETGASGYACMPGAMATPAYGTRLDGKKLLLIEIDGHAVAPVELMKGDEVTCSAAVCYTCAAKQESADMIATGTATLYWTPSEKLGECKVTNWTGVLSFEQIIYKHHPRSGGMGAPRTDVWFTGPDGKRWHGVHRGNSSNLLRCKRLRDKPQRRARA